MKKFELKKSLSYQKVRVIKSFELPRGRIIEMSHLSKSLSYQKVRVIKSFELPRGRIIEKSNYEKVRVTERPNYREVEL